MPHPVEDVLVAPPHPEPVDVTLECITNWWEMSITIRNEGARASVDSWAKSTLVFKPTAQD